MYDKEENMKYLVFSDIHGSEFYARKIEELVSKEKPDNIILLGDLYYHGPRNSLPVGHNPMAVCEIFNNMKNKILCVKGNCDAEVDEMVSDFEMMQNLELEIGNKNFFFTHGHKFNIDTQPSTNFDVLIYGHFHTCFIKEVDNKIFVNAGSISLPKNNTPNSFLLITDDEIILKDVDENIIDKVKI